MKEKNNISLFTIFILILIGFSCKNGEVKSQSTSRFDLQKDLLLAQFDCKTDVDDLHSVAALATLLSHSTFTSVKYHAVAGAYGIQDGLYVPPNELFQLAFEEENWSDAHQNIDTAVSEVYLLIKNVVNNGGDIWIADAGQSDFSAALVKKIKIELPQIKTTDRIHIVQHSNWNEEVTSPEALNYVKAQTDYHKIPDGNATGNGTPGFRSPEFKDWRKYIKDNRLEKIWTLATAISTEYNGKDGRYNNEAVASGGLDFSDLSETCWIMGIENIQDTREFFETFAK